MSNKFDSTETQLPPISKEALASFQENRDAIIKETVSQSLKIDHEVELLERYTDGNYILLHTNSAYPAKDENLKSIYLKQIRRMRIITNILKYNRFFIWFTSILNAIRKPGSGTQD